MFVNLKSFNISHSSQPFCNPWIHRRMNGFLFDKFRLHENLLEVRLRREWPFRPVMYWPDFAPFKMVDPTSCWIKPSNITAKLLCDISAFTIQFFKTCKRIFDLNCCFLLTSYYYFVVSILIKIRFKCSMYFYLQLQDYFLHYFYKHIKNMVTETPL